MLSEGGERHADHEADTSAIDAQHPHQTATERFLENGVEHDGAAAGAPRRVAPQTAPDGRAAQFEVSAV